MMLALPTNGMQSFIETTDRPRSAISLPPLPLPILTLLISFDKPSVLAKRREEPL